MSKVRKDKQGRVLRRGESYKTTQQLYCYAYNDPLGNRKCIYSKDLGELRDKEKKVEYDRLDGLGLYASARADVNFAFDRYIATKSELRGSTKTGYLWFYNQYVRNGFGKRKLADIRYSDVLMFYNSLRDKGLQVSTIDSVHTLLHPVFQMAVRDNVIRNNPSDGALAELKKKDRGRPEARHALTVEEQRAFLEWIQKPEYVRWKPLFVVMFGTGCRVGEIIGLRWKDIDLDEGSIRIDHNITYYAHPERGSKCEFHVHLPKTASGIRTIPMLEKVKEALLEEKKNQKEYGYHCVSEVEGMKGFIFCNRFGGIYNPEGINRAIKRIVDDYNAHEELQAKREKREPLMLPKFSCHITRHSFCSRLCENETNVKVIQYIMGHKDIRTTLDIYAEVSESKRNEIFRGFNKVEIF